MVLYSLIPLCFAQLKNCHFKKGVGKLFLKDCKLKINKTITLGKWIRIPTDDLLISNSIIYSDQDQNQNISPTLNLYGRVLVMINTTINVQSL
jgi:hypothetical protein